MRRGAASCSSQRPPIVWSSAGPVQRAVDATSATQVAGRAGVGALALLAYLVARRGRGTLAAFRSVGRAGLVVAVCLATVSSAFILALAHTSVAHVLLFQATSPFLAALLAWVLMRERDTAAHLGRDGGRTRRRGDHDRRLARLRRALGRRALPR